MESRAGANPADRLLTDRMLAFWKAGEITYRTIDSTAERDAEELGTTPLVAAAARLCRDGAPEQRDLFTPPLEEAVSSLQGLGDGDESVLLANRAGPGRQVVVYGDYDADGVSATALAVRICMRLGATVRYFIPHRNRDGYGLHSGVMKQIVSRGCDLVLAVDCGTRDEQALEVAAAAGIPVLVFDHHRPGEGEIPRGVQIVNPFVRESRLEARRLCAAAVLWVWAYQHAVVPRSWLKEQTDLVALATVADCMELGPLNRALVADGLERLRSPRRNGLGLLMKALYIDPKRMTERDIAMRLGPSINAAGRMHLADVAVEVLLDNPGFEKHVSRLVELNRKRRTLSTRMVKEIAPLYEAGRKVLKEDAWPAGLLSGIAGRICGTYNQPVALATEMGPLIRGSLRVPPGGNALDVLEPLDPQLEAWGGHHAAAGFSVLPEHWEEVAERLEAELGAIVPEERGVEVLAVPPGEIQFEEVADLERLGPFGMGNSPPRFYVDACGTPELRTLGKGERHAAVRCGAAELLAFNGKKALEGIADIRGWVYRPRLSAFRGSVERQFVLEGVVVP
ncbi:MAG: DHH family phosphoesterase [Synergistales bacterium]|nr:DHH family phosphoesterase [Synergistales bacterium]